MVSLLYSCGVDVGNIGHGRKIFNDLIHSFQCYALRALNKILLKNLPSTGLPPPPPHFASTSDKSTPGRTTNQAVMILTMIKGKKTAFPIAAPPVYNVSPTGEIAGGTSSDLASQVIDAIKKEVALPNSNLSSLVSHQADGQYQATQFRKTLMEAVGMDERPNNADIFFVVVWDVAHWFNLCMEELKDKNSSLISRLSSRCNRFNVMFSLGRGFAEYQGVSKELNLPVHVTQTISTTRFATSAFRQFKHIYSDYSVLVETFRKTRESDDDCDQTKFMVRGRDFVIDLCGVIDVLSLPMEIMTRSQAVYYCLWDIVSWWPSIQKKLKDQLNNLEKNIAGEEELNPSLFPELTKHWNKLSSSDIEQCTFQNTPLLEGWMVTAENATKSRKTFTWTARSPEDCLIDLKLLCEETINITSKRYKKSVPAAAEILKKCLDVEVIFEELEKCDCVLYADNLVQLRQLGSSEFSMFFEYVCSLPHIKELSNRERHLLLNPHLAEDVFTKFKIAIHKVIFHDMANCRSDWFPVVGGAKLPENCKPQNFSLLKVENSINNIYNFKFENDYQCTFDRQRFHESLYCNDLLYSAIGSEFCIAMDIGINLGGSEAVVESFYSVMKTHQQSGGQSNETLARRTIVDWQFPMPAQCPHTIREVAKLYLDGDQERDLAKHRLPVFMDSRGRAKQYRSSSKVLDRVTEKSDSAVLAPEDQK
uniref:uncharacterized protein LOC120330255 n=1 Tax=Styela clava TaxID=7725 RepID=UPI001939C3F4|nr:uncharacterized protein LOC120330255 [Styela clava]